MKISPVSKINFKKIEQTSRKEPKDVGTYETTIVYKEIVKAPKEDEDTEETLQQLNYMI